MDSSGPPVVRTEPASDQVEPLDPDDGDRNTPVPFGLVDADGDFVPDEAEPWICQVENSNTPDDGVCDGDDYTPPLV